MNDSQLKAFVKSELSDYRYTFRFGKRLARRASVQSGTNVSEARIDAVAKDVGAVKVNGSYALASRLHGAKIGAVNGKAKVTR